jgi:hypothetical protein
VKENGNGSTRCYRREVRRPHAMIGALKCNRVSNVNTWRWDQSAVNEYEQTVGQGEGVADALIAMRTFPGPSDMLAYLSMMAPRLVEMRRALKGTGSI